MQNIRSDEYDRNHTHTFSRDSLNKRSVCSNGGSSFGGKKSAQGGKKKKLKVVGTGIVKQLKASVVSGSSDAFEEDSS